MRQIFLAFAIALVFMILPVYTTAQEDGVATFPGVVQTGINHLLGEASFDFPLSIPLVGEYVEGADEGNILTTETSLDAVVATLYHPDLATIGEEKPDLVLLNLPLRSVPVIVDDNGNRETLPDIFEVGIYQNSVMHGEGHITLDTWLQASGEMIIDCRQDEATIEFDMQNLIPDGLYSAWAVVIFPDGTAGVLPFGGVPNVLIPDKEGHANLQRVLNTCPTDKGEGESLILWTTIAYHADGSVYGTRPSQPGLGYPDGTVLFDHVSFPVGVPLVGTN